MADNQSIRPEKLGLPEDLRNWVREPALVRLIYEALHQVDDAAVGSRDRAGVALGVPRTLWAVLTYCYAIGLYASDEIELGILRDAQLRYLAANLAPTASDLRHFRRYHREFLQSGVSRLLELVAEVAACDPDLRFNLPGDQGLRTMLFRRAAERRINQAVLADSMALDY